MEDETLGEQRGLNVVPLRDVIDELVGGGDGVSRMTSTRAADIADLIAFDREAN
jgi:hypothetical protein